MVASRAYAVCQRIAARHYENFPVASWLLPPGMRPHIAAIYAFARTADDFADEGERAEDTRLALLADWRGRLHDASAGRVVSDGTEAGHVFTALAETMGACDLDVQLLDDLISAFEQDVRVKRYDTWPALFDYCRRSANPVGRLVLRVAGYRDAALDASSDALCTALQLTNFWQDVAVDWRKGRLYLPSEMRRASGADERDLDAGRMTPAWKTALREAVGGTRHIFDDGRRVVDGVRGRLGWELRATWLGGVRILERLEAADFDVFRARPTLRLADAAAIGWRALRWGS